MRIRVIGISSLRGIISRYTSLFKEFKRISYGYLRILALTYRTIEGRKWTRITSRITIHVSMERYS